jgi:hypothetical protein
LKRTNLTILPPTNAPQNTAKFYKTFLELLFEIKS